MLQIREQEEGVNGKASFGEWNCRDRGTNERAPFGEGKGREIRTKGRAVAELAEGGEGVVLPWRERASKKSSNRGWVLPFLFLNF